MSDDTRSVAPMHMGEEMQSTFRLYVVLAANRMDRVPWYKCRREEIGDAGAYLRSLQEGSNVGLAMEETPYVRRSRVDGALASGVFGGARLARILWLLNLALIASALLFIFLTPTFLLPVERPAAVLVVASCLLSLACSSVGALVASRSPRNPVGWVFCVMGLLYSTWRLAIAYADYALLVRSGSPLGELAAWISTWTWFSIIASGVLLVLLYPDGRLPSPHWRLAVWAAGGGAVLITLGTAFRSGPLLTYYYVSNPYGVGGVFGGTSPTGSLLEASTIIGGALLCTSCLAAIAALALRLADRRHFGWFVCAALPALLVSAAVLLNWSIERFGLLVLGKTFSPLLRVADVSLPFIGVDETAGTVIVLRLAADFAFLNACTLLMMPICAFVDMRRHGLYGMGGAAPLAAPRWLRAFVGGTFAGAIPLAFVYLAVFLYVIIYPLAGQGQLEQDHLGRVVAFVSGWGALTFFFAVTFLVAFLIARKAEQRSVLLGTFVGLVAAAVQVISSLVDPPIIPMGVFSYLCLGLAGGYFGGLAGRSTLSGGLYRVSRRIGRAKDASAVAAVIGENLGGAEAEGVALWRRDDRGNDSVDAYGVRPRREDGVRAELWGSWTADGREGWPPGLGPAEAGAAMLVTPGERSWSTVQRSQLAPDKKKAWEYSGIRSALLVPLVVPGEAWRGLLMVTFRKRLRFSGRVARAYLTVASQAALVLENLRLIEEARRTGRRGGILLERQRLAREIHDTLAQGFTGIITSLTAAELTTDASATDAASARYLEDAKRIARDSLAEARRLVWALRPESLDRYPLSEALSNLVREWSEQSGIEARETTNGTPRELLPEAEVALVRAAQESLTNVHKHARASRVDVTLTYMNDRVVIDVVDNGVGFDPAEIRPVVGPQDERGFGLTGMRERVEQLGGRLAVETAPGEGTAIAVELRDGKDPETIEEMQ
jgi:signal transduction histidine kinase